ncbi:hypothetical protein BDW74DRAFT_77821 [Aspergillus multicolor]|uniref:uncharacterized protein n=1 Tax=Aspergillus multicolor TaxID=41759 RepID=UPI003CCD7AD4
MTIYNAYSEEGRVEFPANMLTSSTSYSIKDWSRELFSEKRLNQMAWECLFLPTWQTGYLMSRHTFTSNPKSQPPIHPLGLETWTAEDADISAAIVISLSASSKTGRSFAYHLLRREASEEPLGFLQVSQTPKLVEPIGATLKTAISTRAKTYTQLGKTETTE